MRDHFRTSFCLLCKVRQITMFKRDQRVSYDFFFWYNGSFHLIFRTIARKFIKWVQMRLYFTDFQTLWKTVEWRKRCVPKFLSSDRPISLSVCGCDLTFSYCCIALRLDSKYVRNWRKTNGYPSSVIICHICCLDRYSTSILILRWSSWAWLFSSSLFSTLIWFKLS